MNEITKRWREFAQADYEAAVVQFQHGQQRGSAYQIAVFHCHQAIEKLLKSYIAEQVKETPRTHDLTRLRVLAGIELTEEQKRFIDEMNPHYLIPRYPDMPFTPSFSFTYNKKNTNKIIEGVKDLLICLEKK